MRRKNLIDVLFVLTLVAVVLGIPYLVLSWQPSGEARVFNVAGYNLADADPGVWVVSEGRPLFKRKTTNEIRVQKGEKMTLRLSSMDVVHGFKLEGYNLSRTIYPGRTEFLELVADQEGVFEFYCNVRSCGPGHLGMKGILIVEAGP